jgi:Lrp/AsnC family transcriptional regulator of lysine biosynthesis
MDRIDLQILQELTKDAQTPFYVLAKEIGVSSRTVQKRYERMKEQGIIRRSTIEVDLSGIGFQGKAYLMITNAPNQDKALTIEALDRMENVFIVSEIVGDFDLIAVAMVKAVRDVIDLVGAIRRLPGVGRVEVALVGDTAFPVTESCGRVLQEEKASS